MYSVKKGVTISDFSEQTRNLLEKAGYTDVDDLSSEFEKIMKTNISMSEMDETETYMFGSVLEYDLVKRKKVKLAAVFSPNNAFSDFIKIGKSTRNIIKPKDSLGYQENKGCALSC